MSSTYEKSLKEHLDRVLMPPPPPIPAKTSKTKTPKRKEQSSPTAEDPFASFLSEIDLLEKQSEKKSKTTVVPESCLSAADDESSRGLSSAGLSADGRSTSPSVGPSWHPLEPLQKTYAQADATATDYQCSSGWCQSVCSLPSLPPVAETLTPEALVAARVSLASATSIPPSPTTSTPGAFNSPPSSPSTAPVCLLPTGALEAIGDGSENLVNGEAANALPSFGASPVSYTTCSNRKLATGSSGENIFCLISSPPVCYSSAFSSSLSTDTSCPASSLSPFLLSPALSGSVGVVCAPPLVHSSRANASWSSQSSCSTPSSACTTSCTTSMMAPCAASTRTSSSSSSAYHHTAGSVGLSTTVTSRDSAAAAYGDWVEVVDAVSGRTYYWNVCSNVTVWNLPTAAFKPLSRVTGVEAKMREFLRQVDCIEKGCDAAQEAERKADELAARQRWPQQQRESGSLLTTASSRGDEDQTGSTSPVVTTDNQQVRSSSAVESAPSSQREDDELLQDIVELEEEVERWEAVSQMQQLLVNVWEILRRFPTAPDDDWKIRLESQLQTRTADWMAGELRTEYFATKLKETALLLQTEEAAALSYVPATSDSAISVSEQSSKASLAAVSPVPASTVKPKETTSICKPASSASTQGIGNETHALTALSVAAEATNVPPTALLPSTSEAGSNSRKRKKATIPVVGALQKKKLMLVDKWRKSAAAMEEEDRQEELASDDYFETHDRKAREAIEHWKEEQISSGAGKRNANFIPLSGNWRERLKNRSDMPS